MMRPSLSVFAAALSLLCACGSEGPTRSLVFAEHCDARGLSYCDVQASSCQRDIFEFIRCASESPERSQPNVEFVSRERYAEQTATSTGSVGARMERRLRASLGPLGLHDADEPPRWTENDAESGRLVVGYTEASDLVTVVAGSTPWDDVAMVRTLAMGYGLALQASRLGGLEAWLERDPNSVDRWLTALALMTGEAALYMQILDAGLHQTSYWDSWAPAVRRNSRWDATGLDRLALSPHPVRDGIDYFLNAYGVAAVSRAWCAGQTEAVQALLVHPPEGTKFLLDTDALDAFLEEHLSQSETTNHRASETTSSSSDSEGAIHIELPEQFEGFERVDSTEIGRWFTGLFLRTRGATDDRLMQLLKADRMYTYRHEAMGGEAFVWVTKWAFRRGSFDVGGSQPSEQLQQLMNETSGVATQGMILDEDRMILFGGDIDVETWRTLLSSALAASAS